MSKYFKKLKTPDPEELRKKVEMNPDKMGALLLEFTLNTITISEFNQEREEAEKLPEAEKKKYHLSKIRKRKFKTAMGEVEILIPVMHNHPFHSTALDYAKQLHSMNMGEVAEDYISGSSDRDIFLKPGKKKNRSPSQP